VLRRGKEAKAAEALKKAQQPDDTPQSDAETPKELPEDSQPKSPEPASPPASPKAPAEPESPQVASMDPADPTFDFFKAPKVIPLSPTRRSETEDSGDETPSLKPKVIPLSPMKSAKAAVNPTAPSSPDNSEPSGSQITASIPLSPTAAEPPLSPTTPNQPSSPRAHRSSSPTSGLRIIPLSPTSQKAVSLETDRKPAAVKNLSNLNTSTDDDSDTEPMLSIAEDPETPTKPEQRSVKETADSECQDSDDDTDLNLLVKECVATSESAAEEPAKSSPIVTQSVFGVGSSAVVLEPPNPSESLFGPNISFSPGMDSITAKPAPSIFSRLIKPLKDDADQDTPNAPMSKLDSDALVSEPSDTTAMRELQTPEEQQTSSTKLVDLSPTKSDLQTAHLSIRAETADEARLTPATETKEIDAASSSTQDTVKTPFEERTSAPGEAADNVLASEDPTTVPLPKPEMDLSAAEGETASIDSENSTKQPTTEAGHLLAVEAQSEDIVTAASPVNEGTDSNASPAITIPEKILPGETMLAFGISDDEVEAKLTECVEATAAPDEAAAETSVKLKDQAATPETVQETADEHAPTGSIKEDSVVSSEKVKDCSTDLSDQSEAVPTESEAVPTESEAVPTESEAVPTESEAVPTESEAVPTESGAVPTESEAVPTESEAVPTESEAVPAESDVSEDAKKVGDPTAALSESADGHDEATASKGVEPADVSGESIPMDQSEGEDSEKVKDQVADLVEPTGENQSEPAVPESSQKQADVPEKRVTNEEEELSAIGSVQQQAAIIEESVSNDQSEGVDSEMVEDRVAGLIEPTEKDQSESAASVIEQTGVSVQPVARDNVDSEEVNQVADLMGSDDKDENEPTATERVEQHGDLSQQSVSENLSENVDAEKVDQADNMIESGEKQGEPTSVEQPADLPETSLESDEKETAAVRAEESIISDDLGEKSTEKVEDQIDTVEESVSEGSSENIASERVDQEKSTENMVERATSEWIENATGEQTEDKSLDLPEFPGDQELSPTAEKLATDMEEASFEAPSESAADGDRTDATTSEHVRDQSVSVEGISEVRDDQEKSCGESVENAQVSSSSDASINVENEGSTLEHLDNRDAIPKNSPKTEDQSMDTTSENFEDLSLPEISHARRETEGTTSVPVDDPSVDPDTMSVEPEIPPKSAEDLTEETDQESSEMSVSEHQPGESSMEASEIIAESAESGQDVPENEAGTASDDSLAESTEPATEETRESSTPADDSSEVSQPTPSASSGKLPLSLVGDYNSDDEDSDSTESTKGMLDACFSLISTQVLVCRARAAIISKLCTSPVNLRTFPNVKVWTFTSGEVLKLTGDVHVPNHTQCSILPSE